jgi:hypothetical protein
MDHGGETLVGLVGAHGDAFELLDLAEEVFDEIPPFAKLLVDDEELCTARLLGDDNLGAARVEFGDKGGCTAGRSEQLNFAPPCSMKHRK